MYCCKDKIKEIMEENKLSQQALAKILGVGQKTISDWLLEKTLPNAKSLLLIYEKFDITPNEMLGIIDENKIYNNIHHNKTVNINQRR